MQKLENNFRHNAMFSGVTLKSIMLEFSSIIYLTLTKTILNVDNGRGQEEGRILPSRTFMSRGPPID